MDDALKKKVVAAYYDDSLALSVFFTRDLEIISCNERFRNQILKSPDIIPEKMTDVAFFHDFPVVMDFFSSISKGEKVDEISCHYLESKPHNESYSAVTKKCLNEAHNCEFYALHLLNNSLVDTLTSKLTSVISDKAMDVERLAELSRLKSEFLTTLSHELKTPLVSIKGYLDLIYSEKFGEINEKQAKAIRISLRNVSSLNELISSILNYARMDAGKLVYDKVPYNPHLLVSEAIDAMTPIASAKEIVLENRVAESLPIVFIDISLMHRVLINLLENAVKFSPQGSSIIVDGKQLSETEIYVAVIDSGCGIPQDKINKLKIPFYQVDKTNTRSASGLGLGLSICEKILLGHDSTLQIESGSTGSTFSFILPVNQK